MIDLSFLPILEKALLKLCFEYDDSLNDIPGWGVRTCIKNVLDSEFMGSGAYSSVFNHPTDHDLCIRVFKPNDGWAQYADYCIKHPDNPFCPDIYYLSITDNFGIAVIEKLECTVTQADNEWATQVQECIYYYHRRDDLKDYLNDEQMDFISDIISNIKINDLHTDNCMIAFDGRFVITDPSCTENTSTGYYYSSNYMNALNSITEQRVAA